MKRISLLIIVVCCKIVLGWGQDAPVPETYSPIHKNLSFEMLFPEAKIKAFVLSEDDGPVEDRHLIELLNKYQIKGTFNINAGRLEGNRKVSPEELKTVYKGHEIAVHGYYHKALSNISRLETFYEVAEDRRVLEELTGSIVRGMAYAFGSYNENNLDILNDAGILYARTVEDSHTFDVPEDLLMWHPTIHQLGKAHYTENTTKLNEDELSQFFTLTEQFLNTDNIALFYVWGHSWELADKWDVMGKFLKLIAGKDDIFYVTNIELAEYIQAYRNLIYSVNRTLIKNPGNIDVYLRFTDYSDLNNPSKKNICVPAGVTVNVDSKCIEK